MLGDERSDIAELATSDPSTTKLTQSVLWRTERLAKSTNQTLSLRRQCVWV